MRSTERGSAGEEQEVLKSVLLVADDAAGSKPPALHRSIFVVRT